MQNTMPNRAFAYEEFLSLVAGKSVEAVELKRVTNDEICKSKVRPNA